MMIRAITVLSAAAVASVAGNEDGEWQTSPGTYRNFFTTLETPVYQFRAHEGDFEERRYPAGLRMACTTKNSAEGKPEFMDVAGYIFGDNEAGMEIPMTSPVTMEVVPQSDGTWNETMCFYLGARFDTEEPPKPNYPRSEKVKISSSGAVTIYTKEFGGYMTKPKVIRKKAEIEQLVTDAGLQFETDRYFKVGYDAPFWFMWRRNEIWLVKKEAAAPTP